ncbi:MAG: hypothetical protein ABIP12_02220, partial [Terriglobales bacterium]
FFGFDPTARLSTAPTLGLEVTFFELKRGAGNDFGAMSVISTFPERDQPRKKLEWKTWEKLAPEPYLKKSYFVMQKEFLEPKRDEKVSGGVGAGPAGGAGAATKVPRAGQR